jgi:1-acyl-sn-glycerol-3-phosphate acyltransferase
MPLLYDAIALGMSAYRRARFRVTTFGAENLAFEPGTLLVATHRRETDVPVLCPSVYFAAGMWSLRRRRLSFAVREDMFAPGFLAGIPGLPPAARRLLFPLALGPVMEERLLVFPLRSSTEARVGDVLRAAVGVPLGDVLPPELLSGLRARAARLGQGKPETAGDVLRGDYGDLLWQPVTRGAAANPALDRFWSGRTTAAAADFRRLVDLLRGGARLLVFPEGYPSATGEIGPLRRGLGALVRRGAPAAVQPIALAYDPLTVERTRVYVAFGSPVPAPTSDVEDAVSGVLRRTMPLTVGQVVAARARAGTVATPRDLDGAIDEARAEGRRFDPALERREVRARRLREALAAAPRADLEYVAREYASARSS